jgi:hypothetical protein
MIDWLGEKPEPPKVEIKPRKHNGIQFTKENAAEMGRRSGEARRKAIEDGIQAGVTAAMEKYSATGELNLPPTTTHDAITAVWRKFVETYMKSKDLRYMTEATRYINEAAGFMNAKEVEHPNQGGLTLEDSNVIFQIFNLDPNHPMTPQDVIDANFR